MTSIGKTQPLSSEELIEKLKSNSASKVGGKVGIEKKSQVQGETKAPESAKTFESSLKSALDPELKFSAHAKSRLLSRGIELTPDEIIRMQEAIQKAGQKGAKESLILTDKAAFVVSVKNNTVITAVDKNSMKENVFTNIDSTIMI